jgi:hypothetical protein
VGCGRGQSTTYILGMGEGVTSLVPCISLSGQCQSGNETLSSPNVSLIFSMKPSCFMSVRDPSPLSSSPYPAHHGPPPFDIFRIKTSMAASSWSEASDLTMHPLFSRHPGVHQLPRTGFRGPSLCIPELPPWFHWCGNYAS